MSVSLKNKRNTEIKRVGGLASLIHHGSETVRIERVAGTVELDLCGHDTVTTRGKMDKFLDVERIGLRVFRAKGQTFVSDGVGNAGTGRRWPIGGPEHPDRISFAIDGTGAVMWTIPNF